MKLEKEVYIENTATTGELSSITIRGYMETKEREILYNLRDKKAKLTLEVEEPILDDAEKRYLSGVIRPFRDKVKCILKRENCYYENKEYITIHTENCQTMPFPYFEKGTMYKGMKVDKEYTLEELGL